MVRHRAVGLFPDVWNQRDIVDALSDAVISTDREGRIIGWNRGAEALLGYGEPEVLAQPLARFCAPASAEEQLFVADRLRNGKAVRQLETHRLSKLGERVELSLTAVPVFTAGGEATGAATYVLQASADTRSATVQPLNARDANRMQRDAFRCFTDAVADMLWAADALGR